RLRGRDAGHDRRARHGRRKRCERRYTRDARRVRTVPLARLGGLMLPELFSAALVALAPAAQAGPPAPALPRESAVPGGVLLVEVGAIEPAVPAPVVTFDGARTMVVRAYGHWTAVVGVPLSQAVGTVQVRVTTREGARRDIPLDIHGQKYATH